MDIEAIVTLWARRGRIAYQGEGITQLQHGWQCARLARQAGVSPALQLAAWLHDLGHLASGLEGSPSAHGIDDAHEVVGAALLTSLFGTAVGAPVALHVAAKRYLVGTQPGYAGSLSPDSARSLVLQGGPMQAAEAAAFIARPQAREALRLRVWDDLAKAPDLHPPSEAAALAELRALMQRCTGEPARA